MQRAVSNKRTGRKRMTRNILVFLCLLPTVFLPAGSLTEAQQPKKVPRIGFLFGTFSSAQESRVEAFKQGLRDLGYIEGRNITIEYSEPQPRVVLTQSSCWRPPS
jgi:hypothetical protein